MLDIKLDDPILVLGARGMAGGALVRRLKKQGFSKLITPTSRELNLIEQKAVQDFLLEVRPRLVLLAAAKVGGIHANSTYQAEFLYENLMMEANVIHGSHQADVPQLLFLGSTCIYPKFAPQPIAEASLLTSPLEPTNEGYALAKICGLKMCEFYSCQYGRRYFSVMPTNLYGYGDNYHPENSHVIPALIRRFHEAKKKDSSSVTLWGTGTPKREFLFADDLADACVFLLGQETLPQMTNIGSSEEVTIRQLGELVAETVGFKGDILQDATKPDGTPRKKTDTSLLASLGWTAKTSLKEGLALAYKDFLEAQKSGSVREV